MLSVKISQKFLVILYILYNIKSLAAISDKSINRKQRGINSANRIYGKKEWIFKGMSYESPLIYDRLFMSKKSSEHNHLSHEHHVGDSAVILESDKKGYPARKLRYEVALDTSGDFILFWDVDMATELIYFRLEAKIDKTDILAFGFSDYGEASNADLVVMWTDYDGSRQFQDTHTDDNGLLHIDRHQDYVLDRMEMTTKDDLLILEFHRRFDTCDDDDYLIDSGTTHLIFFVAPGPQPEIRNWNVTRESPPLQRVQLLKSQLPDPAFPPDTNSFVMHVDDVPVPAGETTYWCAVRKLPSYFREKHHIIQFEGAISKAGMGIVHHLEVFHCQGPEEIEIPNYDGPCSSKSERPKGLESCKKVIGAWAMGAQPLSYPEEAGSPIGGRDFNRYVMLEVHYNNPEHKKGIIDSSGIRFYYTKMLRKHDAGIMELGLEYTDKMALPPGLPRWDLVGYCIPECTQVGLPEGGIKIFASQLHTHLTGRKAYTKHYRRGSELRELNRDNHFSPHYQEIRKLPKQVHVIPGDALITTCSDRTLDRTEITLGGFAITDEMCVNYVHYYPLTKLEVCKSSVTTESLYGIFKFFHEYQGEETSNVKEISDNYKSIKWTPMNIKLLKEYYQMAPLSMQCNQSDGHKFPGFDWEKARIPTILTPMPSKERPCLQ